MLRTIAKLICTATARGVLAATCTLSVATSTAAMTAPEADQFLKKADSIKSINYAEFVKSLAQLDEEKRTLDQQQNDYLAYLHGWKHAYDGHYAEATPALREVIKSSKDPALRYRAGVTIANVYLLAKQYEEAFKQLGDLLNLLPQVADKDARIQGLAVAGALYNQVGEYELGTRFAQQLILENPAGRGACYGRQLVLEARYKGTKAESVSGDYQAGIDECNRIGEHAYANMIRTYLARLYMDLGRLDDAASLLETHYEAAAKAKYRRLMSEYDSLLAQVYRQKGDSNRAKEFALRAVQNAVSTEYTRPTIAAYQLLYSLAKEQGDQRTALSYHEKFAAADKGYLDDIGARQIAFQRVKHEVDASKLQIDSLNKQNEVLQLQRQLSDKAVENIRLYIALLAIILIFIVLWAYRTKRSQLHFMKLSRRDGLTGIFNRPHFIELAEAALTTARKENKEVVVILCDLDHFKSVNDNYGHVEGDYVLQRAVTACQNHLRVTDLFARIGGEEFGILFSDCTLNDAQLRAERLRGAVESSNIDEAKFKVSASFGVATSRVSGYELRMLMTHADIALYQAKRAGRNRVAVYEGTQTAAQDPNVIALEPRTTR